MLQTLALSMPGPFELMIIAGIGLMIFGKRLPSVGRNMALGIRGFQQGLKDTGTDEDTDDKAKSLPDKR
jgi:sec-independent protein translocase protein TatA